MVAISNNLCVLSALTVAAVISPGLASTAFGQDDTCLNPTSKPESLTNEMRENVKDNPAARAAWFLNGRRLTGTGLAGAGTTLPARRLLQSLQQASQMKKSGLAAAPPNWRPLGPAPQRSLYWGNVSGRVTSVAADTRNGTHVLYVGTAFGGLWTTPDYTATNPHFAAVGDTVWPSLAVGSIAIDSNSPPSQPATLYVGTGEANNALDSYYGVGILKSTDGGKTWSISMGRKLEPLSSAARYDWDGPFVGAAVSKIIIDPPNRTHLFAAVTSSYLASGKSTSPAIYESSDGGASWHSMALEGSGAGKPYNCTDLVYEPVQGVFYAAIQDRGIFKLVRGGSRWTSTTSPFGGTPADNSNFYRAALATRARNGEAVVYAVISAGNFGDTDPRTFDLSKPGAKDTGMVQTADGGSHWMPVPAPATLFRDDSPGQGFYDQWIAAPEGGDSLLVGGIDIWRSESASAVSWTNLSRAYQWADGLAHPELHMHPDQHAIFIAGNGDWIVGNDGGVWRTGNSGASWTNLNTDIDSIQFMSVTPLRGGGGYLGGSQDNGTTLSKIAGDAWSTTLTGDGGYTSDNPGKPTQYFTERFYVSLCRSDDSGQKWSTVVSGSTIDQPAPFYVPYQFVHVQADEIALGTQSLWLGPAMPSSPGAGWRQISGRLAQQGWFIQSIASAPSAPQKVYVATGDSRVWFNPDIHAEGVAANWVPLQSKLLPGNRVFVAVAVDPKDYRVAYLGVQGFGTGHVFRTDDTGKHWTDITPFLTIAGKKAQLDTPVNSILIDPKFPLYVYAATDIGVFVTADRGATWQPHGVNLPRTAVVDLKMSTDRRIIAATHGRGAWAIAPLADVR